MATHQSRYREADNLPRPAADAARDVHRSVKHFEQTAEEVLTRLRATMSRLVAASPSSVRRATDLQRVLDVRASLAWQVFRVATARGPFETVPHIPRSESMTKIFDAARLKGFAAETVEDACAAYKEFDHLVRQHAGDRSTFDAMIAALGGEAGEQIGFKQRRAAFRANANLWGFQVSTLYRCTILNHTPGADVEDAVAIRGLIGLRVNRHMPALPVAYRTVLVEREHAVSAATTETPQPWVLEEFCSSPLPEFSTVQEGDCCTDTLHALGIGETARVDYFLAMVLRKTPVKPQRPSAGSGVLVSMPAEELVMDVVAPRGLYDPASVTSSAYGHPIVPERAMRCEERYRMPSQGTGTHLGTTLDALHDASVPRCPEMLRYVLDEVGWSEVPFDLFRCHVRFPILHTVIDLRVSEQVSR